MAGAFRPTTCAQPPRRMLLFPHPTRCKLRASLLPCVKRGRSSTTSIGSRRGPASPPASAGQNRRETLYEAYGKAASLPLPDGGKIHQIRLGLWRKIDVSTSRLCRREHPLKQGVSPGAPLGHAATPIQSPELLGSADSCRLIFPAGLNFNWVSHSKDCFCHIHPTSALCSRSGRVHL